MTRFGAATGLRESPQVITIGGAESDGVSGESKTGQDLATGRPEGLPARRAALSAGECTPRTRATLPQAKAGEERLSRSLAQQELPLAGYLFARAADSRHVDDKEDIDALRSADESVREAREHLSIGRGNVTTDLDRSNNESQHRTLAGRQLKKALDEANLHSTGSMLTPTQAAGASMVTKAGNCGEFSRLSAALHADKLKADEIAVRVEMPDVADHVWVELQRNVGTDRDIILDAWTEGPAIFEPDAAFSSIPARKRPLTGYRAVGEGNDRVTVEFSSQGGKPDAPLEMVAVYHASQKTTVRGAAQQMADHVKGSTYVPAFEQHVGELARSGIGRDGQNNYPPQYVLHPEFAHRVMDKLENQGQVLEGRPRADPELLNEVMAAHVARGLGSDVASAARDAPRVVQAARNALDQVVNSSQGRQFAAYSSSDSDSD